MSQITVSHALLVDIYESLKLFAKDGKKLKELREQVKKLEEIFKNILSQNSVSEQIQVEKSICISYVSVYLAMFRSDIPKVVEQCIKSLKLLLNDSRVLSVILPSEIDKKYATYRNLSKILVELLKTVSASSKNLNLVADFATYLLCFCNDIHLDEMQNLNQIITKLYLQCFNSQYANVMRRLQILNIHVLSQKYGLSKSSAATNSIQQPAQYQAMEIEMMYYADYKQFLITLENHLSSINQYQQNQISIE